MLIGYARVSRQDQDTALQVRALRDAGVRRILEEKASAIGVRVVLERALDQLREADVLVVYKLDRLARSVRDLLAIIERINAAGAALRSLTEAIDTTTPAGRLALQMLGAVGQYERDVMRERSLAGTAAARARGVAPGAPRKLSPKDERNVVRLFATGHYTKAELARLHKVSLSTLKRALERQGADTQTPPLPAAA